jgi:preprotein translocase subunit SecE
MTTQTDKNKQVMQRLIAKKTQTPRDNKAFVEELRIELKRIDWPSRKTVTKSTIMILVIVLIATIFVSVVDSAFSEALLFLRRW